MTTLIPYYVTKIGDRVDQICVKRYGTSHNDVVVYVFNNNPGLEDYGIVLPDSVRVLLPDLPPASELISVRTGQLPWV